LPVYFGLWKLNTNIPPPPTAEEQARMNEAFLAMIKSQMQEGVLKEEYTFLEGGHGYFITGDVPEEKIHEPLRHGCPSLPSNSIG